MEKRAISAEKGEKLLISVDMHDGSLLRIGKGDEDWIYLATYRTSRLNRSKAKEQID
ncbi:hypothetical protein [uncultured Sunxiuqinia sp.]|uniref:hypothetical protein n=1 Tax=uncultured Sunxiuqinia sp. TaxID=1573825 RepID=UPI002AA8F501|nr:hypothetical protein [uncultured Sunxiuqinia sp.]